MDEDEEFFDWIYKKFECDPNELTPDELAKLYNEYEEEK